MAAAHVDDRAEAREVAAAATAAFSCALRLVIAASKSSAASGLRVRKVKKSTPWTCSKAGRPVRTLWSRWSEGPEYQSSPTSRM